MRGCLINQDIVLDVDKRLIKKLWKVPKTKEFPEGLEFAYQYLYFKSGEWIQVARIDNMMHEGKPGSHIHTLRRQNVEWAEMTFEEAELRILEYGQYVIDKIINRSGENENPNSGKH